jgi:hypothetical protein
MSDFPGELIEKAIDLKHQGRDEEAAALYIKVANILLYERGTQEDLLGASSCFFNAADCHFSNNRLKAETCLRNAQCILAIVGSPYPFLGARWACANLDYEIGHYLNAATEYLTIAEAIDPKEEEHCSWRESLLRADLNGVDILRFQPSSEDFTKLLKRIKRWKQQHKDEPRDFLAYTFRDITQFDFRDCVTSLFFWVIGTATRKEITSKWKEIWALAAYARASICFIKARELGKVTRAIARTQELVEALRPDTKSLFSWSQWKFLWFRDLEKAAAETQLWDYPSDYYYEKMKAYTEQLKESKRYKKFILYSVWRYTGGYGEKVFNYILTLGLIVLVFFPILFATVSSLHPPSSLREVSNTLTGKIIDYLYFSIVTFSTLGYGDITPRGLTRIIASIEALTGFAMLGLFLTIVARKLFKK